MSRSLVEAAFDWSEDSDSYDGVVAGLTERLDTVTEGRFPRKRDFNLPPLGALKPPDRV